MVDLIPRQVGDGSGGVITFGRVDVAGPLKQIFGDDAFSFDKCDIDVTWAPSEPECANQGYVTNFLIDIRNMVFIRPFVLQELYFKFYPPDLQLEAKAVIRNIEVPLLGIFFFLFFSVNQNISSPPPTHTHTWRRLEVCASEIKSVSKIAFCV